MTNIVVKKRGLTDPTDRQEGMIEAGDEINDWISDTFEPPAENFFEDVFDNVTDDPDFRFFLDTGSAERRLRPTRKQGVYRVGKNRRLIVRCEDDAPDGERRKRMTIGVPEDRKDLLSGGYIDKIIGDLWSLLHDGTPPSAAPAPGAELRSKKYLLASIFLNRCH